MNKLQKQNLLKDGMRKSRFTDKTVYCIIKNPCYGYATTRKDVVDFRIKEGFKVYAKIHNGKFII